MSRLLVALVLALGLGVVTAVAVGANAGPHGGYDVNTSACAACHRAHTAIGPELLVAEDEYALCTSCHSSATGATTDVINGMIVGTTDPLNGGGFEFVGGPSGIGDPVTSTHTVLGLNGGTGEGTAWGSLGPSGEGPGVEGVLECTSCHNPHGSVNYRILKDTDNGHGAPTTWEGDEYLRPWSDYQVLETDNIVGMIAPSLSKYSTPLKGNFTSGMSFFCANCHTEYLSPSHNATDDDDPHVGHPGSAMRGSEPYNAGDGKGALPRFRHAITRDMAFAQSRPVRLAAMDTADDDGDPTALNDGDGDGSWDPAEPFTDTNANGTWDPGEPFEDVNGNTVWDDEETWDETNSVNETSRIGFNCLSCHNAHGTAATMAGYAEDVAPTNDSALLYYDNREICIKCHQRDK